MARKPVTLVSYGGISGGLRSAQAAKLLITGVKMMPIAESVPIPMVTQYVGDDGVFRPTQIIEDGARLALGELHKWAAALKPIRG